MATSSAHQLLSVAKPYDGTTDVYEFLKRFELAATILEWNTAKQATCISAYLTGDAESRFDLMTTEDKKDIAKIKEHLIKECGRDSSQYLCEFYDRCMDVGEQPKAYGLELQKLLKKALPKLSDDDRDQILRVQFLKNLPPHMQGLAEFTSTKSWSDLLNAVDKSYAKFDKNGLVASSDINSELELEINKLNSSGHGHGYGQHGRFNNNYNNKTAIICHNCGKRGHKASKCWSRPSQHTTEQHPRKDNTQTPTTSANYRNKNNSQHKTMLNSVLMTIGLTNPSKMLRVNGNLRLTDSDVNTNIPILIDTGASHSFIHPKCLPDEMRKILRERFDTPEKYNMAFGESSINLVKTTEQIKWITAPFHVKIDNWSGIFSFVLSDVLNTEHVIIGKDFLDNFNTLILNKENKLVFDWRSNLSQISKIEKKATKTDAVSVDVNVSINCVINGRQVIKARSEQLVKIKPKTRPEYEANVMLFEGEKVDINGLCWAKSINKLNDDGTITVSVINNSNSDITMKDGIVGTVSEVEQIIDVSDIIDVDTDIETGTSDLKKMNSQEKIDILMSRVDDNLNEKERNLMKALLAKYVKIFNWNDDSTGVTSMAEHSIDTGNHSPIKSKQYRVPYNLRGEMDRQVEDMGRKNVIRKSKSPWNSPVILIKKKNGSYRFVVDFRKINDITTKDAYPLPLIDQSVESLGFSNYFVTLDFANGYWGIPLKEEDKQKTAFTVNDQLFEFNVMPFGLTNAPATFQRTIDTILSGLTWRYCLVYLDDVIIFARSFNSLLERMEEVFKRIELSNLKLQPAKCVFGARQVKYLGFIISNKGLSTDPEKCKTISDMSPPTSWKGVKRCIGSVSFYRRFIENFSELIGPLLPLADQKTKFIWTKEAHDAFDHLKAALNNAPILVFPDFSLDFSIECDASKHSLGAVLIQERNGFPHPICFASRRLTSAERNYSTTERELLCIVWAAKYFRNYIFGRKVRFYTDHKPLVTAKNLKEKSGRLARLFFKLQDIEHEILYKKGKDNVQADFLSRIQNVNVNMTIIEPSINWEKEQNNDTSIALIKDLIKTSANTKQLWSLYVSNLSWFKLRKWFFVEKDILFKLDFDNKPLIVVPDHLKQMIFNLYHESKLAGQNATKFKAEIFLAKYERRDKVLVRQLRHMPTF